jgi:glycosyl transferase family 87
MADVRLTPAIESQGAFGRISARAWADRVTPGRVIVVLTLIGLALRLYYLSRPGYLTGVTEYDDGSYLGSAIRLVHGQLPYKDFVFVQPPGITLLMTPVALISELTGTGVGMVLGRLATVLVGTAGIAMTGLLVRHRGVLAVLLACGIVAIHPDSIAAAHTILVEPWLVLFCLAGALAFFRRDRIARSGGRIIVAGLAFGFAGVIEGWAIVPVAVLLAILARQPRRAISFAVSVAIGFLIPTLPFAALAPTSFYKSIIVAQVGSRPSAERVFGLFRIRQIIGLSDILHPANALVIGVTLAVIVLVLAGALVVCRAERRLPAPLEWFAAAVAGLMVLLFLWPPQFHYHFVGFLVPFMAVSIALAASGLMSVLRERAGEARAAAAWGAPRERHGIARVLQMRRIFGRRDPQEVLRWGASVLVMIGIVIATVIQISYERTATSSITPTEIANVQRVIPPGACVLADQVSYTVVANRFWSDAPGCPAIDDGTGVNYALSNGLNTATGAGQVPAVENLWKSAFAHSQYIWLSFHHVKRIPWTPAITAYFHEHFVKIPRLGLDITVYKWVPSGGTATVP